ncbi:potassium-transporting ATPase subunit KdpA [Conexivisphaera calida]|uniref:potassium-transporting ATPase subunit KdpA n=1 Tax=Conexivisphaera calida TaxID=1874277 RepID=UPI00157B4764|nr:potassium-transporting ATPase subunit KdpA [Conexivisphaera calida]
MSLELYAVQLISLMSLSISAAYALSRPLARLISPPSGSRLLSIVDAVPRRVIGRAYVEEMSWRRYLASLLALNGVVLALDALLLALQPALGGPRLSPDLIFNIASSFVTNTDLQHYAGSMLTTYSQALVITYTMFVAPASGLAASFAFIRGFTRRTDSLGNFYADFTRSIITVLLPLSFISALLLILMGVPQTLQTQVIVGALQGGHHIIRLGPVASLESIKLLGNNGGGYYSANSASPLENPSGISNFYESFLMLLLPLSIPLAFGRIAGTKRGASILGAMLAGMGVLLGMALLGGAVIGVEPRLGAFGTLLFNTVSMATNTGATASSLLAMSPLAVSSFLMAMFVQAVPGAIGVGFMYMMIFVVITLFILGLMVGKTPEIMGMKISPRDVKISAAAFLVHPLAILIPLVLAFAAGQAQHLLGTPGPLQFTEVLYEFTSAAANNGSDYLGVAANSPFWNYLTGIVMLVGRFVPLALMMALAGSFAGKDRRRMPEPVETQGLLFAVLLLGMTFLLTILTFFPFLILGPFSI